MVQSVSEPTQAPDWRATKKWYTHETLLVDIVRLLAKIYYYPQVKLQKVGFENMPQGPAIMVANHINNNDVPLIGLCFPKGRHIYFMTKMELFNKFEWFFRCGGAFPINRGEYDAWAFEHVGKILAAGQICMIYPEGTRNRGEKVEVQRAKTGAVRLAVRYQVPILPCAIIGPEGLPAKRFRSWRPVTARVALGKLIDIPALAPQEPTRPLVYRDLTDLVMYQLAQLLPEENRGFYAKEPKFKILTQLARPG